jgi:hypothetical protein
MIPDDGSTLGAFANCELVASHAPLNRNAQRARGPPCSASDSARSLASPCPIPSTSPHHTKATARAPVTVKGVITQTSPSVTERYSEFESGLEGSDDVDAGDKDEDKEVPDLCTEDEEEEEEQVKRVLSDTFSPRSSHTSRSRSPNSLNSTASSHPT